MKKSFLTICVALKLSDLTGQVNWEHIYPGHILEHGITKLIAKKNAVFLFNSNTSGLLKSTDYGATWAYLNITSDSSHHEYTDITFLDDKTGYIAGYEGSLFSKAGIVSVIKKTTDGGVTWKKSDSGLNSNSMLTNISFFNHLQGTAFGTTKMETVRFATDDGGLNWTSLPNFGPDMPAIDQTNLNGDIGFAAGIGHYMHVAVSHDQGSTWNTKHFHNSGSVTGLQFFNAQNGIVTSNDSVFTTNDGLTSFSLKTRFPYSLYIKSFVMLDIRHGYFCDEHNIYYTRDGGVSWNLSYTDSSVHLAKLAAEGNYVFASTYGTNLILRLDVSDQMSGIFLPNTEKNELSFYPNPAYDRIHISSSEHERLISVTFIDQLGRVVKKQSLEQTHSVQLNELNPGAYILEIESEQRKHVKKLVVQPK